MIRDRVEPMIHEIQAVKFPVDTGLRFPVANETELLLASLGQPYAFPSLKLFACLLPMFLMICSLCLFDFFKKVLSLSPIPIDILNISCHSL